MATVKIYLSCDESESEHSFVAQTADFHGELKKYLDFIDHEYKKEYLMTFDEELYDKDEEYYCWYSKELDLNFYINLEYK